MKLWKRAGPVALSLALCAGLVSPALAHTLTFDGVVTPYEGTVQQGVKIIEESGRAGTITMDRDETVTGDGVLIEKGNVTLDLNGRAITNSEQNGTAIKMTGGKLTLQDSSEDKNGKVEAAGQNGYGVYVNGGAAEIKGGEVKATGDYGNGVYVSGGTATIKDNATVSGKNNGVHVGSGGTATISGNADVTGRVHGVYVNSGEAEITGGEVKATGASGNGVSMSGGEATISGGEVKATGEDGNGVYMSGGTATISGNANISGNDAGVSVSGRGTAKIEGGKVIGENGNGVYVDGKGAAANITGGDISGNANGVYVNGGEATISGGTVSGDSGVLVNGVKATISGGTVSGNDSGVLVNNSEATISGGTVTGKTGVKVGSGSFTMNDGTVGSTVKDGAAIAGSGTITLKGGTIYGKVPDRVDISNVTVKAAPYVPPAPDPDPASDPLTRPAAARTLLEELFRRAGGSGELWTWAVENGLVDEDGDGDEIVTVALLRSILTRYAEAFGGNAVAAEDLTTLTGADADIVRNCRAVLNEFFGG